MSAPSASHTPRGEPQNLRARAIMPSITVKDLNASSAWYADVLGMMVAQRIERDGRLVAIAMRAGECDLLLNQDDGAKGWDRAKYAGISLTLQTAQSPDAIAARIKAKGGTLLSEPADMPWGARMFRVQDPDGLQLSISAPLS